MGKSGDRWFVELGRHLHAHLVWDGHEERYISQVPTRITSHFLVITGTYNRTNHDIPLLRLLQEFLPFVDLGRNA